MITQHPIDSPSAQILKLPDRHCLIPEIKSGDDHNFIQRIQIIKLGFIITVTQSGKRNI